jgi:hypothetical protein
MYGKRLVAAAFGLLVIMSAADADAQMNGSGQGPFVVFDGLLYKGKPDLGALGMRPIRGINPPATANKASDDVDEAKVRAALHDLQAYAGAVYLDYEMWPTSQGSAADVSKNIGKLNRVLQVAHETLPAAKIGYYNVIPCWDYWGFVNNDRQKIQQWQSCNVRIGELAQHVDIVMPSLYTYYNDPKGWDLYATALLQAAHRYGKPVYAFLWPEFHVSNRLLKDQNLPANFWRHELEFCKARADGIVIWGGYQKQWDEQAPWWLETKAFLAGLNSR